MNILFTPITIGGLTLPNRIVVPPMCQYSAATDGRASNWHVIHYGGLALSGAGLLIVEATAVEPEGRISGNDLGIWCDMTAQSLGYVVKRVREYSDIPIGVQLAHAGRKGSRSGASDATLEPDSGGWQVMAPSAIAYGDGYPLPRELKADDIGGIVRSFGEAATRADRIGFDAVEIHAAHGYLLHEFLSPIANRRDDEYGGSLENRMRFPLAVFDAVRAAFPASKPVGIRISGSDWVDGGWTVEESVELARELEKKGCSFIHVSGGGLSLEQKLRVGPGYQVSMARTIRQSVSMPVITVGLIIEAEQAETILQAGDADMIAVGRAMLFNPRWPWHAAARLGASVKAPPQYHRAKPFASPKLFDV